MNKTTITKSIQTNRLDEHHIDHFDLISSINDHYEAKDIICKNPHIIVLEGIFANTKNIAVEQCITDNCLYYINIETAEIVEPHQIHNLFDFLEEYSTCDYEIKKAYSIYKEKLDNIDKLFPLPI